MPVELIEHNPLLKQPILEVLALCKQDTGASRQDIELKASAPLSVLSSRHVPSIIVDILIRNDALTEEITIEGKPYDGSLLDMQIDSTLSEDTDFEQFLTVAPKGIEILREYGGDVKLRELLSEKPKYAGLYLKMLDACNTEEGCTRGELEGLLNAQPELAPVPQTGEQKIYAQYFIDMLETAGGIAWQESWRTTNVGRVVLR